MRSPRVMEEAKEDEEDEGEDSEEACPVVMFRPPPMAGARGASKLKGGRRLSGRRCWNFAKNGECPFGDRCKYVHDRIAAQTSSSSSSSSSSRLLQQASTPPRKYMLLKSQKQLGPDPSQSLLVAILEQDGRFERTTIPEDCDLLWGLSYPTGNHFAKLPPRALVNHFPNTASITHKHRLVSSLRALGSRGTDIAPLSYVLPAEATELAAVAAAEQLQHEEDEDDEEDAGGHRRRCARWIVKRAVGGEGKGITVVTDAAAALECARRDVDARLIPTSLESSSSSSSSSTSSSRATLAFPSGSATKKNPKDDNVGAAPTTAATAAAASHVVQRLVSRPLLVSGFKVDIGAYLLVTSWGGGAAAAAADGAEAGAEADEAGGAGKASKMSTGCTRINDQESSSFAITSPPRAYLYDEGLVRFAMTPFDPADTSPARHLTNNAFAKSSAKSDSDGAGSKSEGHVGVGVGGDGGGGDDGSGVIDAHFNKHNWSLARFRTWIDESRGAGTFDAVWERAGRVAATAVIAARPSVFRGLGMTSTAGGDGPRRHFCLLGLDLLVDEDLRVWLLEVNSAPSLAAATRRRGRVSELHHDLKAGLVADALNIVAVDNIVTRVSNQKKKEAGENVSLLEDDEGVAAATVATLEEEEEEECVPGTLRVNVQEEEDEIAMARAEAKCASLGKFKSLSPWFESTTLSVLHSTG